MNTIIVYFSVIAFVSLKCCMIAAQDYPPVIDETLKVVDSRIVKCAGEFFLDLDFVRTIQLCTKVFNVQQ